MFSFLRKILGLFRRKPIYPNITTTFTDITELYNTDINSEIMNSCATSMVTETDQKIIDDW